MINRKPNHDNHRDHDHANDNSKHGQGNRPHAGEGRAHLAGGTRGGAQQRRHGVRRWPFRAADAAVQREGSGTWSFGQRRTVVEDGSRWAVNPLTFKWGYISFGNDNRCSPSALFPSPSRSLRLQTS